MTLSSGVGVAAHSESSATISSIREPLAVRRREATGLAHHLEPQCPAAYAITAHSESSATISSIREPLAVRPRALRIT